MLRNILGAYKAIIGHRQVHSLFKWLWKAKCQMKHKVFFWLLLKDRINTRDILQRRGMVIESVTCDLCILQRREIAVHLILRCNFAQACWASIGVNYVTTRPMHQILRRIRSSLGVPFATEIIILMCWSIWTTRNSWIFNNRDPSVQECKAKFCMEFKLILLKAKRSNVLAMESWLALQM